MYLPCLFLSWLTVATIQKAAKDVSFASRTYIIAAICVLCVVFLPEKNVLPNFKYVFPFYILGHLLAEQSSVMVNIFLRMKKVVIGTSAIIFLACYLMWSKPCYLMWSKDSYVYTTPFVLGYENIPNIMLRYVGALSGTALFSWVAFLGWKKIGGSIVCELGNGSLYVYVLQMFFFSIYAHLNITPPKHQTVLYVCLPILSFLLAYLFLLGGKATKRIPLSIALFGR